jgi:hypothetical protein
LLGQTVTFTNVTPSNDDGSNGDYLLECSHIDSCILLNYVGHSVDLNTYVQLSKSMDIPYLAVRKGFERFIKAALKDGRAKEIHSCYETAVYEIIG